MKTPRWLDDDELRAWRNFSLMQLQLFGLLGRELTASGLSYQDYLVLAGLSDQPDNRSRPVELGTALGWEKSRVSHHISRMEQRGLVAKVKCPSDGRGWLIAMTDAGRAAIADAAPGHVEVVRRHFIDLLSPDEISTLDAISTRVLERLDDSGAPSSGTP